MEEAGEVDAGRVEAVLGDDRDAGLLLEAEERGGDRVGAARDVGVAPARRAGSGAGGEERPPGVRRDPLGEHLGEAVAGGGDGRDRGVGPPVPRRAVREGRGGGSRLRVVSSQRCQSAGATPSDARAASAAARSSTDLSGGRGRFPAGERFFETEACGSWLGCARGERIARPAAWTRAAPAPTMRRDEVTADERRLQAELPEFLDLLENVAGYVGGLDLAKAREVPAEALSELRDGLLRALGFLHELFALRGEPPPSPEPGIAFGALGPSLKRTLPQRLAAQLADELNAVPGRPLEDVSQFAALGLVARVADLLRFVGLLPGRADGGDTACRAADAPVDPAAETAPGGGSSRGTGPSCRPAPPRASKAPEPARRRPTAPAPAPARSVRAASVAAPPPAPAGPGPDLSAYDIRIDEAGERVDAGRAAVWFASAAGPRAVGEGRAASFAVTFPGGVAFAVAEGAESSLGARLASVVAVRAFCRAAAANPSTPEAAVRTAQHHLDMLLSALLSAGDATEAFTRVRGSIPPANARRILKHTREPEEALRRVTPALATSLVGAVAVLSGSEFRVSVVRLGPGLAEARVSGRVTSLLGGHKGGALPLLGPGARGAEDVRRTDSAVPVSLSPGDALLLGTPALAKGATSAWAGPLDPLASVPGRTLLGGDGARSPPPGGELGRDGAPALRRAARIRPLPRALAQNWRPGLRGAHGADSPPTARLRRLEVSRCESPSPRRSSRPSSPSVAP